MIGQVAGHNRKNGRSLLQWISRFAIFMAGLLIMSYGITLMIMAGLGLSPWDVLHMGMKLSFGLTVGTWSQIVGILIIGLAYVLTRQKPTVGTVINMICVGMFTDMFLASGIHISTEHNVTAFIYLVVGIIVMGIGAGMYIASEIGAGPRDGLMLALSAKLGWSIRKVKTVMEMIALVIGFLLGGPVFIGTLIFTLTIGPVMQTSIFIFRKLIERLMGREVHNESFN